ncbi:hypothetical protein DPX39_090053800 [Trypanosoma brucei equiperdum]|uniref:Uncharacterized protein n=1 Tax=Trypanosoma brucei equiperdum TaxID=630700 RepID=A0A3L6L1E2_9TRYP|nr:hypothetical protein DPX39_090053800 [Trypanosoma brucei equiperdum]
MRVAERAGVGDANSVVQVFLHVRRRCESSSLVESLVGRFFVYPGKLPTYAWRVFVLFFGCGLLFLLVSKLWAAFVFFALFFVMCEVCRVVHYLNGRSSTFHSRPLPLFFVKHCPFICQRKR